MSVTETKRLSEIFRKDAYGEKCPKIAPIELIMCGLLHFYTESVKKRPKTGRSRSM